MIRFSRFVVGLLVSAALAGGVARADEPLRTGAGERRSRLDSLELKPFPEKLWSSLSDWKNGAALTPADTTGKVVLIATWSDYHPISKRALAMSKRLADKYAKDGLVVVAVHQAQGWDAAEKPAAGEGATFRLALDAKGEFRRGLEMEQDPNLYVVDRAGQLRYAAITSDTTDLAIQNLLKETREAAAGTMARLDADRAAKDANERKTRPISERADLTALPELPFAKPSASDYKDAHWPRMPRDESKTNTIAYLEPKQVSLPTTDWLPKKPNLDGRIVVLYFWHWSVTPEVMRILPDLDRLQRQYGRDVVVVGVLTAFTQLNNSRQLLDEEKDPEKMRKRMKEIFASRQLEHYFLLDTNGESIFKQIFDDTSGVPIPAVAVVGSDSMARWWSSKAAVAYDAAILRMMQVDPGVKARRKAEEEYLRSKGTP